MTNHDIYKRINELKKAIAQESGLEVGYDNYFFLARIGSNYHEYGFNWEAFRDLAGPLEVREGSLPIVIVSEAKFHQVPELRKVEFPTPHYQICISPNIPVVSMANIWLDLLVDDKAMHGHYQGPFNWFVIGLGINADQLSQKGRDFLKL